MGSDGDFKVREKKALKNDLVYRKKMSAHNIGTVWTDVLHNAFVIVFVDYVVGNDRALFSGVLSLVSLFPAVEHSRKFSLVIKGQIVNKSG